MIEKADILTNISLQSSQRAEQKMKQEARERDFAVELDAEIDDVKTARGLKAEKSQKKLKDACVEMESLFVARLFKEMRKTVHKGEWLHGGNAEEIFEDMLYDQYALDVSKNSRLGLADMLYKELSRNEKLI